MNILEKLQLLPLSWFGATIFTVFLGWYFIYVCALVFYRLYLSPLASIPGSKFAAATGWYETYYQLIKEGGGRFTFQVEKWHDRYGTILSYMHPSPGSTR